MDTNFSDRIMVQKQQKTKESGTNIPKKTKSKSDKNKSRKLRKSTVKKKEVSKSNVAITRRRKKAYELALMGFKNPDIADQLNVSVRAVEGYLNLIREEHSKSIERDKNKIYADLLNNMDLRKKRLWSMAIDPETSKRDKISALSVLSQEDKELVKRMQTVGILAKDIDTQVNIQQNKLSNVTIQIVKPEDIEDD